MKQVGDQFALQHDVIRIQTVFMMPAPVTCSDVFGCSENVGISVQTRACFVSRFDSGDWKHLYKNYELDEYRR
jgi:hypothetical protein